MHLPPSELASAAELIAAAAGSSGPATSWTPARRSRRVARPRTPKSRPGAAAPSTPAESRSGRGVATPWAPAIHRARHSSGWTEPAGRQLTAHRAGAAWSSAPAALRDANRGRHVDAWGPGLDRRPRPAPSRPTRPRSRRLSPPSDGQAVRARPEQPIPMADAIDGRDRAIECFDRLGILAPTVALRSSHGPTRAWCLPQA